MIVPRIIFCFELAPNPIKLYFFDNFGNSEPFHTVLLEQLSCKKVLKVALLGNCFSDLLAEVGIWYLKTQVCLGRFVGRKSKL